MIATHMYTTIELCLRCQGLSIKSNPCHTRMWSPVFYLVCQSVYGNTISLQTPSWAYLICAIGILLYQVLDAIDGKQARRTGSNNQLGEIFDHGCDAISTFCVAISGISAAALNEFPYLMLAFVLCIEILNYIYHWQTYVSGVLYFKRSVSCLILVFNSFIHM